MALRSSCVPHAKMGERVGDRGDRAKTWQLLDASEDSDRTAATSTSLSDDERVSSSAIRYRSLMGSSSRWTRIQSVPRGEAPHR